jgi:guanylate kinase
MNKHAKSTTTTGNLYIIAAPSGAGKTSLVKQLLALTPEVEVSVSHTTRPRRPGEQDGTDYYFVDADTFHALVQEGVFLEHARVFDYHYGTSRYAVMERLRAGIDVILEIDWQGARQVRAQALKVYTIFILPPSRAVLRQRLQHRGQDTEAVIERRMQDAISEISHYHEFDFIVINDDFKSALEALRAIFIANRQLREVQVVRYREVLQVLLS